MSAEAVPALADPSPLDDPLPGGIPQSRAIR